jgi:hypothetical protein
MPTSQDFQTEPSFEGEGRGAPIKWPFLNMEIDQLERITERSDFASARSAVAYAKKARGFTISTRIKDGILFVKRLK